VVLTGRVELPFSPCHGDALPMDDASVGGVYGSRTRLYVGFLQPSAHEQGCSLYVQVALPTSQMAAENPRNSCPETPHGRQ
jgi:hypothetical protein